MYTFDVFSKDHDDVTTLKQFPCYWRFVRGIHGHQWIPLKKGQSRGALMLSLVYVWTWGWINIEVAGNLRRHGAHYGVTVMIRVLTNDWVVSKTIRLRLIWKRQCETGNEYTDACSCRISEYITFKSSILTMLSAANKSNFLCYQFFQEFCREQVVIIAVLL